MTVERRCGEDRRQDPPRHDRRGHHEDDKYWVSPGARIWLVAVSCGLALLLILLLPIWVRQGNITDAQRARDEAARVGRVQGAQLLHNFDCTYGKATRLTLAEAARSQRVSSHISLQARHAAQQRGNKRAAHRSLITYRNAKQAAATYAKLAAELDALGRHGPDGKPIPPCPKP